MGTGSGSNKVIYLIELQPAGRFTRYFSRLLFKLFILTAGVFISMLANAQTPAQIITELKAINDKVLQAPCNAGRGMLISNKAMNVFLSNKVSSYLSDNEDLSLYKNYVIADAANGAVYINHNLHQPVESDDYVRSFVVIGGNATVATAYTSKITSTQTGNQLGFTIQKTWMGKPVTRYDGCNTQKLEMDSRRAEILHALTTEITKKAADFEQEINSIQTAEVPGRTLQDARAALRKQFYSSLQSEYVVKFSEQQADVLINTNNYMLVTDSWTTVGLYLPIIRQQFKVSNSLANEPVSKYSYPVNLILNHTRFWDSPKYGRAFIRLGARAFSNNTVQSGTMLFADAVSTGSQAEGDKAVLTQSNYYIGNYKNFITYVASGKLVYIPPDSHVGISFKVEKNFGTYHALNSTLGIPIVLIDKNGVPAINFEMQLLYTNINHTRNNQFKQNRTTVGLTVGIPFSKIVY